MLLLDVLDPFRPTRLLGYLNNLMSVHGISRCFGNAAVRRIRRLPQNWLATSSSDFDFQVGCLNQMPFWPTHLLGYLNDLMSVHGISKCFGNAAVWRIRRLPQNWLATSSSDFDFQVGCLNQMPFWPTHLLGYLSNLLSVHGISKCFGNASLGRIRRLPQNWLATSFRDFDFQVGCLNLMPFWPTHLLDYLSNLLSVHGISKCFGNASLGRIRRLPQNWLATSSRDFDFQVGCLNLMPFWPTHLLDYLNNLLSVHGISKCFGNASLGRIRRLPQNWLATSSRDFDFQDSFNK